MELTAMNYPLTVIKRHWWYERCAFCGTFIALRDYWKGVIQAAENSNFNWDFCLCPTKNKALTKWREGGMKGHVITAESVWTTL